MHSELSEIIEVCFDIRAESVIRYSAFVKYNFKRRI